MAAEQSLLSLRWQLDAGDLLKRWRLFVSWPGSGQKRAASEAETCRARVEVQTVVSVGLRGSSFVRKTRFWLR